MTINNKKVMSFFFPTIANFLWLGMFLGTMFFGRKMMNADGDLALHLATGRYILEKKTIPLFDVFSHTMPGQPITQHEWLSTIIFAWLDSYFGLQSVVLLSALVIATTILLVFNFLKKSTQSLLISVFVSLLVMVTSMVHWLTRPHIFTFLLLVIWIIVLENFRTGKEKRWWLLPLVMLIWVNLHGGFIIGFISWILLGIGVFWDRIFYKSENESAFKDHFPKVYFLSVVLSFLASLLNPSGIFLWKRVISHVGNKYLADVTLEFQSPNFHDVHAWPFLIYIGLLIFVLGLNKTRLKTWMLFSSAAWLLMGLFSARNIPLFAFATAPLFAEGLKNILNQVSVHNKFIQKINAMDKRLQNVDMQLKGFFWQILIISLVIIGLIIGIRFDKEGKGYDFDPEVFPVEAVDWLVEHPQEGNMFNYFTWGGYLQLRLWPEFKVFIDSKSDFYGEEFVRMYAQVIGIEEGWQEVLEEYKVSWAILPAEEAVARSLQSELGWKVIYEDETTKILKR